MQEKDNPQAEARRAAAIQNLIRMQQAAGGTVPGAELLAIFGFQAIARGSKENATAPGVAQVSGVHSGVSEVLEVLGSVGKDPLDEDFTGHLGLHKLRGFSFFVCGAGAASFEPTECLYRFGLELGV
eukprot:s164_g59.t1